VQRHVDGVVVDVLGALEHPRLGLRVEVEFALEVLPEEGEQLGVGFVV
jgi:hypothetical protein